MNNVRQENAFRPPRLVTDIYVSAWVREKIKYRFHLGNRF